VLFDSEKFMKLIGQGTTVMGAIALVRKLLPLEQSGTKEDDSESDGSDIEVDGVYDMFHMIDGPHKRSDGSMVSGGEGVSLVTGDHKKISRKMTLIQSETLASIQEAQRQLTQQFGHSLADY
jgi:hypothetical protein